MLPVWLGGPYCESRSCVQLNSIFGNGIPLGEVIYPETMIKLLEARSHLHRFRLPFLAPGKNGAESALS